MTRPAYGAMCIAAIPAIALVVSTASVSACATAPHWSTSPQVPGVKRASVVPGSWDRVATLPPLSRVVVALKNGDRLEGAFKALEPATLALIDAAGTDFSVARSDVARITRRAPRDELTNGALIGAGIGLGSALAILGFIGSGDGYVLPSAKWGAPLLLSSAGAIVGALVDRRHHCELLLFVASG